MIDYVFRFTSQADAEAILAAQFPQAVKQTEAGVSFILHGHGWAIDPVGIYSAADALVGYYVNVRVTDPDRVMGQTTLQGIAETISALNGVERPAAPYRWWAG